ncbi:MAG: primosomal protein N' [Firmicutes bacterium]|nr:primosomal protein N' [Bacillota bacterium]
MKYADVVIDNNTDATDLCYTYAYEGEDEDLLKIGRKVVVPFGVHNKEIEGYVVRVYDEAPAAPDGKKIRIKKIASLDHDLCLSEEAVRTALWMHGRYICRYIEAVKCFLPVSEVKRKIKDPFADIELKAEDADPKSLTKEQEDALSEIGGSIERHEHKVYLLKGVTGSGKTEVYLQSMKKVIDCGRQGIVLVPEISLTPQVVARFMSRFGKDRVAVLHSKLTPAQRSAEYKRIEKGEVDLVIGARSAVFAPFENIGLIVLDEEHETSYKSDKSPKYDCLEVATKRAIDHGAVLVLGSATPSVVDYYRSEKGLFKRIEIKERFNRNPLPNVEIVDMAKEIRSGNRSVFSSALADAVEEQLQKKKQVILFLNRRGYSNFVSCRECGFVIKCGECGISMPYHKDTGFCECHYCGRKIRMPKTCPECGSKLIGGYGAGTQQVEEKAKELFPDANIERLDLDSIKKKGELESTLKRFEKGKTDILIGTQLVAKGLDFSNVGLVGIINADVTLNIPDFRASERTFQLMTQAAGRSGRGDERGKVMIQTYSPENRTLLSSAAHDYEGFYKDEIDIRKAAGYPPFTDIYQIVILDEDQGKAEKYARDCAARLRKKVPEGTYVLGPAAPMLLKNSGMYRYQILIKTPAGNRQHISGIVRELKDSQEQAKDKAKLMTVDINPFSFN